MPPTQVQLKVYSVSSLSEAQELMGLGFLALNKAQTVVTFAWNGVTATLLSLLLKGNVRMVWIHSYEGPPHSSLNAIGYQHSTLNHQ